MEKLSPYLIKKRIGEVFGVTRQTVKIWCDGLESEVWKGRYPMQTIAGKHYNLYALIDYLTYKDSLEDKNLRKTVPKFDPIPIARLCGQEGVRL